MIHKATAITMESTETGWIYVFEWGNARSNGRDPRFWYTVKCKRATGWEVIDQGNGEGTPDLKTAEAMIRKCI